MLQGNSIFLSMVGIQEVYFSKPVAGMVRYGLSGALDIKHRDNSVNMSQLITGSSNSEGLKSPELTII